MVYLFIKGVHFYKYNAHYDVEKVAKQIIAETYEVSNNMDTENNDGKNISNREQQAEIEGKRALRIGIVLAILAMLISLIAITNKVTIAFMNLYSNTFIYWHLSALLVGLVAMLFTMFMESARYIWLEACRCDVFKNKNTIGCEECDNAYAGLLYSCKLYTIILGTLFFSVTFLITYYSRTFSSIMYSISVLLGIILLSIIYLKKHSFRTVVKKAIWKMAVYVMCWLLCLCGFLMVIISGKDEIHIECLENGTVVIDETLNHEYEPIECDIYSFENGKIYSYKIAIDDVLFAKSIRQSVTTVDDIDVAKATAIDDEIFYYHYKMNITEIIKEDGKYEVRIVAEHDKRNAELINMVVKRGHKYEYAKSEMTKKY